MSYTVFVRARALTRWYAGIYWRRSHQEDRVLVRIMKQKGFPQRGSNQVKWKPCFCPHGSATFSSSWILLKTARPMHLTDAWSSLSPQHVGRQAQTWCPQHWYHGLFDESMVNLHHSEIIVPANSIYFLDAASQWPFDNMTKNSGTPIRVVEADYGLIRKYYIETSADGSSSGICVPTRGCGRRLSGVSIGYRFGCFEWYPAATKRLWTALTKTRPPVCLISSILTLDAEKGNIFNRCSSTPWVWLLLSQTRHRTFRWHLIMLQ